MQGARSCRGNLLPPGTWPLLGLLMNLIFTTCDAIGNSDFFNSLVTAFKLAREASLLLMAWSGLLRIGEVFAAQRRDRLVLPTDGAPGCDFALLQINQPKTRGVSAKHQAARIDPQDVAQLLSAIF